MQVYSNNKIFKQNLCSFTFTTKKENKSILLLLTKIYSFCISEVKKYWNWGNSFLNNTIFTSNLSILSSNIKIKKLAIVGISYKIRRLSSTKNKFDISVNPLINLMKNWLSKSWKCTVQYFKSKKNYYKNRIY